MTIPTMETRNLPALSMRAAFAPRSVDTERRTAQLTFSTGAAVTRLDAQGFYREELSLEPGHVRTARLVGGPVLDSHQRNGVANVLGVVEAVAVDSGVGVARVRFDEGEAGTDALRKVAAGILRDVSVGYAVHKFKRVGSKEETRTYRAIDWEPMEISLVAIGADPGATIRTKDIMEDRSHDDVNTIARNLADLEFIRGAASSPAEPAEPAAASPAAAANTAGIIQLAKQSKLGLEWAAAQIATGATVGAARAAALEELVRRDGFEIAGHVRIDGGDQRRDAVQLMAEALASRYGGPPPSEPARQYTRLSPLDFARHMLESNGVHTRMMSKNQIVERALAQRGGYHTTSDFAALLTDTGNRLLRTAYDAAPAGVQVICKQGNAPDFRPINKLQLGEAPTLKKVSEHGEYTRGSMASTTEAYSIATFGRVFGLSRQAIVNDDLGAFSDMALRLGRSAREFVASQLTTLLVSNPALATDGKAVFHADHGNLAAAAAAIDTASLGIAVKSMRLQKGLDGVTPINVTPKYLVVPATQEVKARQAVAAVNAAQTSNANVFSGAFEVVIEPRLDAVSAIAWYLAADPRVIDTIEYAYLDGAGGPEVIMREGFDVDGVEWKVRLDFGAGILDFRGLYKNPGA